PRPDPGRGGRAAPHARERVASARRGRRAPRAGPPALPPLRAQAPPPRLAPHAAPPAPEPPRGARAHGRPLLGRRVVGRFVAAPRARARREEAGVGRRAFALGVRRDAPAGALLFATLPVHAAAVHDEAVDAEPDARFRD